MWYWLITGELGHRIDPFLYEIHWLDRFSDTKVPTNESYERFNDFEQRFSQLHRFIVRWIMFHSSRFM